MVTFSDVVAFRGTEKQEYCISSQEVGLKVYLVFDFII